MSIDDLATASAAAVDSSGPRNTPRNRKKRSQVTRLIKWAGIGVFILMNITLLIVLLNVDAVREYLGVEPTVITLPASR